MSFADNLKQIRKQNHLSQEDVAELLDVSRQAVSKWELGDGYPEVEKLLLISKRLHISLDQLMASEIRNNTGKTLTTGSIMITSPHENVIVNCYNVVSSGKMKGGKDSPQYALFAVSDSCSYWGQSTIFLGWYADKESISKERHALQTALTNGEPAYELQYSVKVERHRLKMKIVKDI